MKLVRPVVIKLAETRINPDGVREMLKALGVSEAGMKRFANMPDNGETLCELAGRTCYESFEIGLNPNVTRIREDSKEYFKNLISKGDGSVCEHGQVSFCFLGVSRIMTHELARHRVGTAISQESLRYVRPKEIRMWLPEDLDEELKDQMVHVAEGIEEAYRDLEKGISWGSIPMETKKRLTSALRRILFDGIATNVVWTANYRTLRWVIEMRTDPSAEIEIRMVFDQVARICKRDYPVLFQDFVREELPDGTGTWKPGLRSKV